MFSYHLITEDKENNQIHAKLNQRGLRCMHEGGVMTIYQCSIDTTHARIPKQYAMYSERIFTAHKENLNFHILFSTYPTRCAAPASY